MEAHNGPRRGLGRGLPPTPKWKSPCSVLAELLSNCDNAHAKVEAPCITLGRIVGAPFYLTRLDVRTWCLCSGSSL